MRNILPFLLLASVAFLPGCGSNAPPARDRANDAADAAFASSQQGWRDARREGLLAPDGWTSLVGLHWIEPGSHFVGSDPGSVGHEE